MAKWRIRLALLLALLADGVQLGLIPLFGEGAASPFDDVLDVMISVVMIALVGWHWSFAPAFLAELVPGVDLAPTWTLAAWMATREKVRAAELPAEAAPVRASEQTVEALPAVEPAKRD